MSTQLVKLNDENIKAIKALEGEGISDLVKQFYLQTDSGQIFIKKAGVLFKMNQLFGIGKYSAYTEFLTPDEFKAVKEMAGVEDGKAFAAFRGVVKIGDQVYTDIGTAFDPECRNGKYVEMASTRALLRAMKIATGCGFSSPEEMESEQPQKQNGNGLSFSEIISQSKLSQEKILEIATKELGTPVTTLKQLDKGSLKKIVIAIQNYIEENTVEGTVINN